MGVPLIMWIITSGWLPVLPSTRTYPQHVKVAQQDFARLNRGKGRGEGGAKEEEREDE